MNIVELTPEEYKAANFEPYHVFNSVTFNKLTAEIKGVAIQYLGIKTTKYKLGIIGSISNGKFFSPFSAPFGGFSYAKSDLSLESIDQAIVAFINYLKSRMVSEVEFVLPPLFYETSFISKLSNSLYRLGFQLHRNDLNHSLHLDSFGDNYLDSLYYNAKKNLRVALGKDFHFQQCVSIEEKEMAYDIIKQNREARGFPIRMDFDTVRKTISVVKADFFTVTLEGHFVASAMVFHVAKEIVQVVYWGDLPQYSNSKTMNFLSYSVIEHYKKTQIKIIDIGPSTQNSLPNYGLCDFKESIGCSVYPKQTWTLKL